MHFSIRLSSALCILTLSVPTVCAQRQGNAVEDDLKNSVRAAIEHLRVTPEIPEDIRRTYKNVPLTAIASFSYPQSWATRSILQFKKQPFRFSSVMNAFLLKTMSYTPTVENDGSLSFRMPLDDFFNEASAPFGVGILQTDSLKTLRLQKPITTDIENPLEGRGYIQLCSYDYGIRLNATTSIINPSLEMLKASFLSRFSVRGQSNNDVYVKNLFSSSVEDATLFGLPAVRVRYTASSTIFSPAAERVVYEGLYALRGKTMLCAEVRAEEAVFPEYHDVFEGVLATVVLEKEQEMIREIRPTNTALSRAAARAEARKCRREKTCLKK